MQKYSNLCKYRHIKKIKIVDGGGDGKYSHVGEAIFISNTKKLTMTGKEKIYKVFVEMCRLDPELMGEVCAWNNMSMEADFPEEESLQKRYIALRKKAWEYVQAMEL